MHADRQTGRQADRQTGRQADRHTYIHTYSYLQSHMFIHTYTFNSWFPKTTAPEPESRPNLVKLKGETNGSGVLPTVRAPQIGNSGSESTRTWRLASKMALSEISELSHTIHGAGIYANIGGILMVIKCYHIWHTWILWVWKNKTKTERQRDLQHRYVVNDVNGKRPRQYNTRCFAIAF